MLAAVLAWTAQWLAAPRLGDGSVACYPRVVLWYYLSASRHSPRATPRCCLDAPRHNPHARVELSPSRRAAAAARWSIEGLVVGEWGMVRDLGLLSADAYFIDLSYNWTCRLPLSVSAHGPWPTLLHLHDPHFSSLHAQRLHAHGGLAGGWAGWVGGSAGLG